MEEFNTTINKIPPYLTSIYNKIASKGGTMPAQKNSANVAAAIRSIPDSTPVPTTNWGILYTNQYPSGKLLASESDYHALAPLDVLAPLQFSFGEVDRSDVIGYEFGKLPTSIDPWFLSFCYNLNMPLIIPSNITSIGIHFLDNCQNMASTVSVPASVTTIGDGEMDGFMWRCRNFTGPLIVDCLATPVGGDSLSTRDSTQPIYATGVTIKGKGAAAWMASLPNGSPLPSGQYRKLILG